MVSVDRPSITVPEAERAHENSICIMAQAVISAEVESENASLRMGLKSLSTKSVQH